MSVCVYVYILPNIATFRQMNFFLFFPLLSFLHEIESIKNLHFSRKNISFTWLNWRENKSHVFPISKWILFSNDSFSSYFDDLWANEISLLTLCCAVILSAFGSDGSFHFSYYFSFIFDSSLPGKYFMNTKSLYGLNDWK